MEKKEFFLLLAVGVNFFLATPLFGWSKPSSQSSTIKDTVSYLDNNKYYTVVGVFAYHTNAVNYTKQVIKKGCQAHYGYYPPKEFYYVYTYDSRYLDSAQHRCRELRLQAAFSEAWIFHVQANAEGLDVAERDETIQENAQKSSDETYEQIRIQTEDAYNHNPVGASIKILSGRPPELQASGQADEVFTLPRQMVEDTSTYLTVHSVGYRSRTAELAYSLAMDSIQVLEDLPANRTMDTLRLPLIPMQSGDRQILQETYFYPNASVMRERSQYEMEGIVQLMKDRPDCSIRLHGHTNKVKGNWGTVFTVSKENPNFFTLLNGKEYLRRFTSSRKLSQLRAETIKLYLVERGIEPQRIEVKGWGSSQLLYHPDSPECRYNIRVEIELLAQEE